MKSFFLGFSMNILLIVPLIAAERTVPSAQHAENKCLILCDDKSVETCAQSCRKQLMKHTLLLKLGIGTTEQKDDSYKKCAIGCMTKHCLKVHWQIPFATKN